MALALPYLRHVNAQNAVLLPENLGRQENEAAQVSSAENLRKRLEPDDRRVRVALAFGDGPDIVPSAFGSAQVLSVATFERDHVAPRFVFRDTGMDLGDALARADIVDGPNDGGRGVCVALIRAHLRKSEVTSLVRTGFTVRGAPNWTSTRGHERERGPHPRS